MPTAGATTRPASSVSTNRQKLAPRDFPELLQVSPEQFRALVAREVQALTAEQRAGTALIFSAHSLPVQKLEDGTQRCKYCDCDDSCRYRDGLGIATNFTENTVPAPVPSGAKILVGTAAVPAAGVTVWQQ